MKYQKYHHKYLLILFIIAIMSVGYFIYKLNRAEEIITETEPTFIVEHSEIQPIQEYPDIDYKGS